MAPTALTREQQDRLLIGMPAILRHIAEYAAEDPLVDLARRALMNIQIQHPTSVLGLYQCFRDPQIRWVYPVQTDITQALRLTCNDAGYYIGVEPIHYRR